MIISFLVYASLKLTHFSGFSTIWSITYSELTKTFKVEDSWKGTYIIRVRQKQPQKVFYRPAMLLKRDSSKGVFLWILRSFCLRMSTLKLFTNDIRNEEHLDQKETSFNPVTPLSWVPDFPNYFLNTV